MLAELVRTANPKLVVINYPHNPTGAAFTAVEVARIAGICEDVGAYLFGDEMYRWLEHPECDEDDDDEEENSEDDPPAPAAALYSPPSVCELYDRGISAGRPSPYPCPGYASAGWRVPTGVIWGGWGN
jgi:aspartate/methionine/tyrosine aminotransferase